MKMQRILRVVRTKNYLFLNKCSIAFLMLVLFFILLSEINFALEPDTTIVGKYGQLRVEGNKVTDENGNPVSLRGMSLFWSQWEGARFYNYDCVKWLRDDWKCTVIRAAMGIESGGYLDNPTTEKNKITAVVDACIDLGIYVIIDWHDHNAQNHQQEAIDFFAEIAQQYGEYPNLLYEIFNEPTQVSWANDVKPYAEAVIDTIRNIDPDNIIIVGSPTWSQDVDVASQDPLDFDNIVYSLHFYAATHKQWLRSKATTALNNGVALFVSEFGTCESSGDGPIDYAEVEKWMNFMETNKLSWCNWSIADKDETSAALMPGASGNGGWLESDLTESGALIREKIIQLNDTTSTDVGTNLKPPSDFKLYQNYPNPFNPNTMIGYSLPKESFVSLTIFNSTGQIVKQLVNDRESAGSYELRFDAEQFASGVYFYQLRAGNFVQTKMMMLLK